jgi:hypothetical protein
MQVNIWSHVLPFFVCAYWLIRCLQTHPVWSEPHYAVVAGSLVCGSFCFGASVCYHLLMPTTPDTAAYRRLMMVDLAGIWFVNLVRQQRPGSRFSLFIEAESWFGVVAGLRFGFPRYARSIHCRLPCCAARQDG